MINYNHIIMNNLVFNNTREGFDCEINILFRIEARDIQVEICFV